MKKLYGIDHDFGGENADVKGKVLGTLGVEASDLVLEIKGTAKVGLDKIVTPVTDIFANGLRKVEQWIPGDQKNMVEGIIKDMNAELVKFLGEQVQGQVEAPV